MSVSSSTSEDFSPHHTTLKHASLLAMKQDKPIMLDYYAISRQKQCKLVKTQDKDTILYKSQEEYTSPLQKLFKIDTRPTSCRMRKIERTANISFRSTILNVLKGNMNVDRRIKINQK